MVNFVVVPSLVRVYIWGVIQEIVSYEIKIIASYF